MKEDLNSIQHQILTQEDNLDKFVTDLYYFSTLLENLKKDFKNHLTDLNSLKKSKKITIEEYQTNLKTLKNLYKSKMIQLKQDINKMADLCMFTFEKNIAFKKAHKIEVAAELIKLNSEIKDLKKKASLEQATMLETLKEEKLKTRKPISTKTLVLISVISLSLLIIGTLLINYLLYFPKTRNESFDLTKKEYLIAFIIVLITLIIIIGYFILMLKVVKKTYMDREKNIFKITAIGFVGSFLDTIGVGSFAVATAGLKATKIVKNDALLPGTINIGLGIPNLIAGTTFVAAINVEVLTLVLLVVGAILGSFVGAELTKRISAKHISLTMAIVLAIVAILMILTQLNVLPSGNKTGLEVWQLGLAFILFMVYGGLQAFGIGLYAPALATIALLGMDIKVAFPIMTLASGSAFPVAAYSYYKNNKYQPKTGFGLMLGGALGVVLAFLTVFVGIEVGLGVKPDVFTNYLKWLAVIVVFYVAIMLLLSYLKIRKKPNANNLTTRKIIFSPESYDQWNEKLVNQLDDYLLAYYDKRQFYNDLLNKYLGKETKTWK
ncbi:TSUP family transporter [Spiroplasma citri]|uniref:Probable membrane transporter protein n=1 Tax=Spiroplasma citri TaxID=2133 RepID=Q14PN4_SPICI|nr:TSUP family transporter [Spiroplasma citri]WFG98684.1 TSUP family transporter [Spiroplasma citri]CAK98545.1 conserved hypothetical transmembrane protein [Spiroplasma citri]